MFAINLRFSKNYTELKITLSNSAPGSIFSKKIFPSVTKTVSGNYDLLYQNSIREYEEDLEH